MEGVIKDYSRESYEGEISIIYKVPKYVKLLVDEYSDKGKLDVLELGAADGEISQQLQDKCFIGKYVVSELDKRNVKVLKKNGFDAHKVDATDLSKFGDASFDLVFCFDVMHHVNDPKKMAQEMMRVSRKHVFLIESNGLCLLRKLLELTTDYKKRGEKSYSPWRYRSFFKCSYVKKFRIKPILFIVPFTPKFLIKPMAIISDLLEHVPLIRWQGSGVVIYGEIN